MKYVYLAMGIVFIGMGGAGVILPLIPTTPFVLLAAICFGRSSERLHKWFIATSLYKNNIEGFVTKRAMTIKAKLKLLSIITLFMGISFFFMRMASAPLFPQIILVIVWVLHVLYFGFKVKLIP